ncbi:probable anion transporter 6, chloroplastic isoform X2 [Cryptomeria japonica]|uniref:probable anion transporter 6, chloroplastic isoform X2 n=1 Tax=Cryptomeria japonica TaxID=3369 RepID=UPI0027DA3568|nr:probable anion transporter 6, chloroplastic isoform X2 [Cryptomeria japonica]
MGMDHLHLHFPPHPSHSLTTRWSLSALPQRRRRRGKHTPTHLHLHSNIHITRACWPSKSKGISNSISKEEEEEVEEVVHVEDANDPFRLIRRYKLIGLTSLAFVICNMDKVNLSVAIIPMSHQLGWNASTAGLVQSSFFWGYALSQLPGGWLAKKWTGRKVLEFGVLGWSLATAVVPFVAGFMPGLIISRIMVGIGEGVSPSAATELIARTIPLSQRSRAVAFVFSGLSVGSVLGLIFAPPCIENFGWESVFYIFGLLGLLWFVGFRQSADEENSAVPVQTTPLDESITAVPWKAFLKSRVVWAMVYVHFCGNWGHYTFLSWLPTYFSEELDLDLTNAALVAVLPSLGSILVSNIAASFADKLISNGIETTFVRKLCQTIAFVSPAICMTICSLDLGLSPWTIVAVITTGLALSSFALAGLYCTHQDISPEFASILLGLTSTAGAFPGIVGVALTGYLLDQTHSWTLALFAPSIFFYITGSIVWLAFASSKPQNFLNGD